MSQPNAIRRWRLLARGPLQARNPMTSEDGIFLILAFHTQLGAWFTVNERLKVRYRCDQLTEPDCA